MAQGRGAGWARSTPAAGPRPIQPAAVLIEISEAPYASPLALFTPPHAGAQLTVDAEHEPERLRMVSDEGA